MKREGELKSEFFRELKRQCPRYVVQQMASAGSPDRSITGCGKTTHWEFKHATPYLISNSLQELMCMRLAEQGFCRYVVWWETRYGKGQRTMIVQPKEIHRHVSVDAILTDAGNVGYDPFWLVSQVRQIHEV